MEIKLVKFNYKFLQLSTKWLQDEEILKLIDAPFVKIDEQIKWFKSLDKRDDYKVWGIDFEEIGIGVCGLKNINNIEAEYFGYIGEKELWGKGLGQQILMNILYEAKQLKLIKVNLVVLKDNIRAIKSYKKFGFKEAGIINDKFKMVIFL